MVVLVSFGGGGGGATNAPSNLMQTTHLLPCVILNITLSDGPFLQIYAKAMVLSINFASESMPLFNALPSCRSHTTHAGSFPLESPS